jgi:hypothetical protein
MFRRIGRISKVSIALALTVAAVAFGFFALGLIEGEGQTKTGKAAATNVPISVAFTPLEGLTPTVPEAMTLVVENTTVGSVAFEIKKLTFTVKTSNEAGCPVSNFTVASATKLDFWEKLRNGGISGPQYEKVAAETSLKLVNGQGQPDSGSGADYQLSMAPTAPAACEEVTVKVHVTAEHV